MSARLLAAIASICSFALPDQAMAANKLSSIFKLDMLNTEIAYLESITGPAMHVYPDRGSIQIRDYRVDGCKVQAFVAGTKVQRYSITLTPRCNFNLGAFLNGYSSTSGLTVGKFASGAYHPDMRVQSDCIYSCGNAADPTVNFIWNGPHAVNFVSVVLTVVLASDAAIAASDRWEKQMRSKEGDDYITDTKFNCDGKYDKAAVQAFATVPVNEVVIGFADSNEGCPR
jgi:hypothetical protein